MYFVERACESLIVRVKKSFIVICLPFNNWCATRFKLNSLIQIDLHFGFKSSALQTSYSSQTGVFIYLFTFFFSLSLFKTSDKIQNLAKSTMNIRIVLNTPAHNSLYREITNNPTSRGTCKRNG